MQLNSFVKSVCFAVKSGINFNKLFSSFTLADSNSEVNLLGLFFSSFATYPDSCKKNAKLYNYLYVRGFVFDN